MLKKWLLFAILSISVMRADPIMDQIHVCTVATERNQGLRQLEHSCRVHHIECDVLGLGGEWKGFGFKLASMKKYLANIPDDHIVMFVDGYDTLVINTKHAIRKKFLNKRINCLFSAETNCFPRGDFAPYYNPSPTKYKYLNSGTFIGYAGYLKKVFNEIEFTDQSDDQEVLSQYYLAHKDEIALDYYCEFFLPLHDEKFEDLNIKKSTYTVTNPITGTHPCVVHGCGLGRSLYQRIYNHLFVKDKKLRNRNARQRG